MAAYFGSGYNPAFGLDPGPPPPAAAQQVAGAASPPDNGPPPPGHTRTDQPLYAMQNYFPYYSYYGQLQAPGAFGAPALGSTYALDGRGGLYQYISGLNGTNRHPQPAPPTDPTFPAANLLNATGGAGAEPGYNYFFPTEHAKVVVLKCSIPPWKLVPGTYRDIPFHACKVPANITMAELLVGFGANNPDKGKNQFWEVYPQGGGRWGWKEHVVGDDQLMINKSVREMGWVEKRADGELPTIYLWITKE